MKPILKFAFKIRNSLNRGDNYNYVDTRDMGNSIPKIIHQTYHKKSFPPQIQENINYIKSINPGWELRIYDDNDILNYIDKNYPKLTKLYNKIDPIYGAARADFFRYLLIYNEGGVYLDIKSSMTKPLEEIIATNDKYLLSHWENGIGASQQDLGIHSCILNPFGEFQQWYIVSVKGHPFLKSVIENVCNNIHNYNPFFHETGRWGVFNLTGPIAYTLAITPHLNKYDHRLERDNTKFGFIYSIFLWKHIGTTDYKLHQKHYSLLKESIIVLPFTYKIVFKLLNPVLQLIKKVLLKLR